MTGFNNTSSAPTSNTLFGANQANATSSAGLLGQSTTQSATPSGGLFGQNDSKPTLFGQQKPFATPSTPSSSSQTPAIFGGAGSGGDAMQTTPDGKTRADAPKAALFGMPTQSNPPFGSNAPSTVGGASIFSNPPPQSNQFTSFGSGASSTAFLPKPTAPTSGGPSLFGMISKPPEQTIQATEAPTTGNNPLKTTGANIISTFNPSGTSLSTFAPPTGGNMFSSSPKPLDQQPFGTIMSTVKFVPPEESRSGLNPEMAKGDTLLNGANGFSKFQSLESRSHSPFPSTSLQKNNTSPHKPKPLEEQNSTSSRNDISGMTASANVFPQFNSSVPPTTATDFASSQTAGADMFSSTFKASAAASAPAADSAPAKTTTDNVFSSAFKPSIPASTQANAGSSLFANPNPPAAGTNLFAPKPSTGLGTSASAPASSGAEAPVAASSASLFGTSNALSAAAPSATSLFGATSALPASPVKPPSFFSAAPTQTQSSAGPSNSMFSATASDIDKKGSEGLAPTSATAQTQPLGNQLGSAPKLFSAAPAFGSGTGGNIFAPKAAAQSVATPDVSSENKAQAPSAFQLTPSSQSSTPGTSTSTMHNMFGQTPKAATTTALDGVAAKSTMFAETSKTPFTAPSSSAPSLFDNSKTAPSAARVFGQKTLFSDSPKAAPRAPSSPVKPPSFSASIAPGASQPFAKPAPSGNAVNAFELKNNGASAQSQLAPTAPATQQPSSTTAAASAQGALQIKRTSTEQPQVSSYDPPSAPQNITKEQKADFDRLFRVRALNESFKKKVAEMDPQAGDFVSLIKYYVRVRDAIGSPTGLVRKGGLKRTGDESFDTEADNSQKRAKTNAESAESQEGKEVANGHAPSIIPSTESETNGGSGASGDSTRRTSIAEHCSIAPANGAASTTKRKAEDSGEGRPNGSPTQAGERARNTQETQSMTSSLFASSFASSIGAGNRLRSGDGSNRSQKDQQNGIGNNNTTTEAKAGSSEGPNDTGDVSAASTNGRSLFDRIQYNNDGQAKRAPTEEESSKEEGPKVLSNLFGGSKFASSFNPLGTPSPPTFTNNFDFAKAGGIAASGRNSPLNNDKTVSQPADLPKPTTDTSGSPAPSIFGTNSISGSQSGPADNTWKNNTPIKFSGSMSTESPFPGASSASNTTEAAASSSSQFPALFGGQSESKGPQSSLASGNLGSSTQQAGFGFASNTPANPAALKFGLSATNSADPSRSTTPGVTSDTTGAEESGDGEGTESMAQVDLTRSGAGEENEDSLIELRANAFKLDKGVGWKKQGVGLLRVLKHKSNGRSRVLLRADPSGKVVLNVALQGGHPYTPCKDSVQLLVPDAEGKLDQWALRVKTAENAEKLATLMKENQTTSQRS